MEKETMNIRWCNWCQKNSVGTTAETSHIVDHGELCDECDRLVRRRMEDFYQSVDAAFDQVSNEKEG